MLACAGFFFCILLGYFMIRPVREAMGVERGLDALRWLFYLTAGISLLVAMLFGGIVHRLDRRRFISVGFLAVIACLVVFAMLRATFGDDIRVYTGRVFYVWLSVINLFLTSVFWAFMADVWSTNAAKRLFPPIAVGGTLGAIAGSSVPWWLGQHLGDSGLMLLAAGIFAAGLVLMRFIDRRAPRKDAVPQAIKRPAITAGLADGIRLVATSPYLLGIGAYIGLMAVSSTVIYFTQLRLVTDAADELERRISIFGMLDMITQVCTLLVQLFLTGRLIRWIGVGGTLAILPVVTVGGFAAMEWVSASPDAQPWMVFGAFAVFQALHRASRYAVARPARETLFSGLTRDETYKAKTVVDLFVYRGGDVAGARVEHMLTGAAAISFGGVALAAAPVAALWLGLGLWLGFAQSRRTRDPDITPNDSNTEHRAAAMKPEQETQHGIVPS